jgi:hypothetical protein
MRLDSGEAITKGCCGLSPNPVLSNLEMILNIKCDTGFVGGGIDGWGDDGMVGTDLLITADCVL